MIDHITFGALDFDCSMQFRDSAFAPLGVKHLYDAPSERSGGAKVSG